jgi:DAK2 domain fusion protein YloV
MKIRYLNGNRFYNAFIAGGEALIKSRNYLNEINVFPVADADTGTNLATTIRSIVQDATQSTSLQETLRSIADSALMGARGNSGIIFAQYLVGISKELEEAAEISAEKFAQSAHRAIKHVYDSLVDPIEGTMLTVMREWAESLEKHSRNTPDICHLLQVAFKDAQRALQETPQKLEVLAEAGVVDAGAKGFVNFLEGVIEFIQKGSLKKRNFELFKIPENEILNEHKLHDARYRYCTEAILKDTTISLPEFKEKFGHFGDSFIVAGTSQKIHLHIHTSEPACFFSEVKNVGTISSIKVDDMHMQYQISHKRKYP